MSKTPQQEWMEVIKMFCANRLKNYPDCDQDAFYIELASWASSQVKAYLGISGPAKTKIIRGFFRGMKNEKKSGL